MALEVASREPPSYGPDARAALTVKIVAMLAASAVVLRTMAPRARWLDRSHRTVALLGFAYVLPHQWTLLAAPGDDAWLAAQQRWSALLALALLTLAWASREIDRGRCAEQPRPARICVSRPPNE